MKNRSTIKYLRQFNPDLKVTMKAQLQYGCEEKGHGYGEYEGQEFEQNYTIGWNDGFLEAGPWDGITVSDVIAVLEKKVLSKINYKDFRLGLGNLESGYSTYKTKWDGRKPKETPDDSELYNIMDIGDVDYIWQGPSSIEFDIHYIDQDGEDSTLFITLSEDESDNKPEFPTKKAGIKKKAAKKAVKKI